MGAIIVVCAAVLPACAAQGGGEAPAAGTASATSELTAGGLDAIDADFVPTPVGRMHRSCIHDVGNNAHVDESGQVTLGDGTTVQYGPCKYPVRDDPRKQAAPSSIGGPVTQAWVRDGWFLDDRTQTDYNGWGYNWINKLDGHWRVPPAPRQYAGQTVYLFTALEPVNRNSIIQPVLQYGPSNAGGGNYWSMAVWYVTATNGAFHGNLVRVNVGDTIDGYMTATSCQWWGACTWTLQAWDGLNLNSTMALSNGDVYQLGFKGVLEAYNITNCNKLPVELDTGTTFHDVHVYQPGPNTYDYNEVTTSLGWTSVVWGEGCSYGIIDTPFGVELYWQ